MMQAKQGKQSNELVFLEVLVKRWKCYMPVKFLLKCKHLKKFSGSSADGTFNTVINVLETYSLDDDYKKKIGLFSG